MSTSKTPLVSEIGKFLVSCMDDMDNDSACDLAESIIQTFTGLSQSPQEARMALCKELSLDDPSDLELNDINIRQIQSIVEKFNSLKQAQSLVQTVTQIPTDQTALKSDPSNLHLDPNTSSQHNDRVALQHLQVAVTRKKTDSSTDPGDKALSQPNGLSRFGTQTSSEAVFGATSKETLLRGLTPKDRRGLEEHEDQFRERQQQQQRGRTTFRDHSPPPDPRQRDRNYYTQPTTSAKVNLVPKNSSLPLQFHVYSASVVSTDNLGIHVKLDIFPQGLPCIVPPKLASRLPPQPSKNALRDFQPGKRVFVKIISDLSQSSTQITASMQDVDQTSGVDSNPQINTASSNQLGRARNDNFSGIAQADLQQTKRVGSQIRASSQERWRQEQAMIGVSNSALSYQARQHIQQQQSSLDPNDGQLSDDGDGGDADNDIAINEELPSFLRNGAASGSAATFNLFNSTAANHNEEGVMARVAQQQNALARERRQLNEQLNKDSGDMNSLNDSNADDHQSDNLPTQVEAYGIITNKSIDEQRKNLPVYQLRDDFLAMVRDNPISVVVGETGSGKTTQMGQYLYEAGYGRTGLIACTQPRRVAATSVAQRVSEEVGCDLGSIVGYSVRFDERSSPETKLKFMTDGMLLREVLIDSTLSRYSVIIIDEAHDRSVNTDILLALIKAACTERPELRFIVTSATLDAGKFSQYLGNCPIFQIPGRTFPVRLFYNSNVEADYYQTTISLVLKLHLQKPAGDILVFLTGKEEIDDAVEDLKKMVKNLQSKQSVPPLDVYPVYSSLPSEIQSKIFEPTPVGHRKCVLATNIAEASVTIDGIVYVIDPGFCKIKVYDPKQGIESLQVSPISQAQAKQRAGRAGRTQPGECYRLYTEDSFDNEMLPTSTPELQRCDLSQVILLLKALGINDLLGFDFLDPPARTSMMLALQQLHWLGAVDGDGLLTRVGARLAMLPIAPNLGKMLLTSADLGCVEDVATVVAMVSGEELWLRPKKDQTQADLAHARLKLREGDHATMVNVFNQWIKANKNAIWCKNNYLSTRTLEVAYNVRLQLLQVLANMKIQLSTCGKDWMMINRAVASGLFMNAARREQQSVTTSNSNIMGGGSAVSVYKTLTFGNIANLHPGSSLYHQMPQYIVYQTLLSTTKEYLHTCSIIHPQWLTHLAPHLFAKKTESTNNASSSTRGRNRLQELRPIGGQAKPWRLSQRKI